MGWQVMKLGTKRKLRIKGVRAFEGVYSGAQNKF